MTTLQAIKYDSVNGQLEILDQLLLPESCTYIAIESVEDAWHAIRQMKVRGAPAIAIVGCLSLAVELRKTDPAHRKQFSSKQELDSFVKSRMEYLVTSRPTAVNIQLAAEASTKLSGQLSLDESVDLDGMKASIVQHLESTLANDLADNLAIGNYGAQDMMSKTANKDKLRILTHCNTGSLATAGYGTALGVVRSLHLAGKLDKCYCTETRPYNQGSRLTAFELVHDKIPAVLICDNMAAAAMKQFGIDAVIVGADRVAANGDVANKIGTYQLAVLAKAHGVLFYVAAPFSSIDFDCANGQSIPIEERDHREMTHTAGVRTAAAGIDCWNPSFDVTPAELITGGIVTEKGVFPPNKLVRH